MSVRRKYDLPVSEMRRFIEPGPILLVSSRHKGETNIMTLGWHMVLDYGTVGCFVWDQNHSHGLIRKSRECVINIPTADMAATVAGIGNCSGRDTDKFEAFGLTGIDGDKVKAPLIGECHASLECRLVDTSLIRKYSLFVFEVVKLHAPKKPRLPDMIHYSGEGIFAVSDKSLNLRRHFKPGMLEA